MTDLGQESPNWAQALIGSIDRHLPFGKGFRNQRNLAITRHSSRAIAHEFRRKDILREAAAHEVQASRRSEIRLGRLWHIGVLA